MLVDWPSQRPGVYFTEVKANENFQNDVYGSNFFPTLHTFQAYVFEKSLLWPLDQGQLDFCSDQPDPARKQRFIKKKPNGINRGFPCSFVSSSLISVRAF